MNYDQLQILSDVVAKEVTVLKVDALKGGGGRERMLRSVLQSSRADGARRLRMAPSTSSRKLGCGVG